MSDIWKCNCEVVDDPEEVCPKHQDILIGYVRQLESERDALKRELEAMKELKAKDAEIVRLRGALEYIELTGGNYGHDGMNKDVPCPCVACMAEEAAKVLVQEKRER